MTKDKQYYINTYLESLKRIEKELIEMGADVSDGTAITYEFDNVANAEEVAGFYVYNEGDNALKQWRMNTKGIDLTLQDVKVTGILEKLYEPKETLTICYVTANTGFTSIIAASKDKRITEEAMFTWCRERNITPEYVHGDYRFQRKTDVGMVAGWLRFQEVEEMK